jgi:hypothetical protein
VRPALSERQWLVVSGAAILALALVVFTQYRFRLNWGDKNLTLEPSAHGNPP